MKDKTEEEAMKNGNFYSRELHPETKGIEGQGSKLRRRLQGNSGSIPSFPKQGAEVFLHGDEELANRKKAAKQSEVF